MHLCYIAAFAWYGGGAGLVQRRPMFVIPYAAAWIGLVTALWPHLGAMAPAVAVYSLALTAMALSALNLVGRMPPRDAVFCAVGAVIFMISDTILAFARFVPGADFGGSAFANMATYIVAQALIAFGCAGGGPRR
jgi:uncharacterized membrane protein YhhN